MQVRQALLIGTGCLLLHGIATQAMFEGGFLIPYVEEYTRITPQKEWTLVMYDSLYCTNKYSAIPSHWYHFFGFWLAMHLKELSKHWNWTLFYIADPYFLRKVTSGILSDALPFPPFRKKQYLLLLLEKKAIVGSKAKISSIQKEVQVQKERKFEMRRIRFSQFSEKY